MNNYFNQKNDSLIKEMKEEIIKSGMAQEVPDTMVSTFYEVLQDMKKCHDCKGLKNCRQESRGYVPVLKNNQVFVRRCDFKKVFENDLDWKSNLRLMYQPKKILEASLGDYHLNSPEREKLFQYASSFISGKEKKGMYIVGALGVGKTYLLASIANELAKMGKTSLVVYFPDLARYFKSAIDSNSVEEKLDEIKNIDYLFLDDFGSEYMTPWLRDEIISPLINYRFLSEYPVFFSSNLDLQQLAKHISNSKDDMFGVKGPRIVQKISEMCKLFKA